MRQVRKQIRIAKKSTDPIPCSLCYYPLDKYGCCEACERRMEKQQCRA